MSEREKQRRAEQSRHDKEQRGSFTVREWCEHRRISPAMFYKLDQQGLAPHSHYVGAKRLISAQADADWIAAREAESESQTAA
jgi:hypothetical protein